MENLNSNQPLVENEQQMIETLGIIERLKSNLNRYWSENVESENVENIKPESTRISERLKNSFGVFSQEGSDNSKPEVSVNTSDTTVRNITLTLNINDGSDMTIKTIEQSNKAIIVKLQV